MFDPLKDLVQGQDFQDAGEDSLSRRRSESSPAARPAEGDAGGERLAAVALPQDELSAPKTANDPSDEAAPTLPPKRPTARRRAGGALKKPNQPGAAPIGPEQRVLLLDTWQRSGLPAGDFAALVGVSKWTLAAWKKRFEELGPAGLLDQPRGGPKGSRLPEVTKRTILMLKESHPEWGCQRISDMLFRGPALPASPTAVARVLHEAGYETEEVPTRPHGQTVHSFERARPNQLWQTDLFTFILKRQNRRVYLVGFLDDQSRFITGYGLHASQSAALVIEVLRAALAAYGSPEEILTDNGTQYVTWRGKSQFTRELEKRGIRQIVARPRRPQTLGKIERFWGTLWRECVETAVFRDLEDARRRIGLFIDHYNFQRAHQGIDGLVPADRYFGAAPEVLKTLRERVAANALELARHGVPKQPVYLTGLLEGKPFSVHREGDRVILHRGGEGREEVDLPQLPEEVPDAALAESTGGELPQPICPDGSPEAFWPLPESDPAPGTSALDSQPGEIEKTEGGEPQRIPEEQEGGAS
jgi:transposase InsO family protein